MNKQSTQRSVIPVIIGVFGGTFDPIHLGHLHIAQETFKRIPMREIRFVPSYNPLLRDQPMASAEDREAMVQLAIADAPHFVLDDREIKREGPSYMFDTLQSLRNENAEASLCLILALDVFAHFHQWYRWQEILNLAHLIVVGRPGYGLPTEPVLKEFFEKQRITDPDLVLSERVGHILDLTEAIPSVDISATQIREGFLAGQSPQRYLPESVFNYIIEHHLYR